MSRDDFDVVAYKVLRLFDECTKRCAPLTVSELVYATKVPEGYLATVLASLVEGGYISGCEVADYYDGEVDIALSKPRITMEGAIYLRENAAMRKVRGHLGTAFESLVEIAASRLIGLASGL